VSSDGPTDIAIADPEIQGAPAMGIAAEGLDDEEWVIEDVLVSGTGDVGCGVRRPLAPPHRQEHVAWIEKAKRDETRTRRPERTLLRPAAGRAVCAGDRPAGRESLRSSRDDRSGAV